MVSRPKAVTDDFMCVAVHPCRVNCDTLKIKPCTVIIHAGYTTEIKDSW